MINNNSSVGKVGFGLDHNAKHLEFPEGNYKLALARLVNQHASHTASSLLKLKSEFDHSKLDLIEKVPNKWISKLEVF